jgi:hypothetical protein
MTMHVAPQRLERHVADVVAVNEHAALGGVVEAREKVEDCRFAAADRSQQRHRLSWPGIDVDALYYFEALTVAEADLLVAHVALDILEGVGVGLLAHLGLRIEYLEDALRGRLRPGRGVQETADHPDRLRELNAILDELEDHPEGHLAVDDQKAAEADDGDGEGIEAEREHRLAKGGDAVRLETLFAYGPVRGAEARVLAFSAANA